MDSFKIINVSTLKLSEYFSDENDELRKKAKKMYKILQEDTTYPFYDGYSVNGNIVSHHPNNDNITDELYNGESGGKSVSICAVVGQNGSGKSSIIELMMRIINNISVMFIGEGFVTPIAAHLHRIHNLYASMLCLVGENMWEFTVLDNKISVRKFVLRTDSDATVSSSRFKEWELDNNSEDTKEYVYRLGEEPSFHKVENADAVRSLGKWFYTIITNYALYSYNCQDYIEELTSDTIEAKIHEERENGLKRTYTVEERCWLKGLFHKNDGYQTPIVINPMRQNGNIDVNKEKKLSLERLMALVHHLGLKNQFFTINDKLEAREVEFTFNSNFYDVKIASDPNNKEEIYRKLYKFSSEAVFYNLEFYSEVDGNNIKMNLFDDLCREIREMCLKLFDLGKEEAQKQSHYEEALQYIVYKILKITYTYNDYREYYDYFRKLQKIDEITKEKIERLCLTILYDHSHLATKLWQTVFYLKYHLLPSNENKFDIKEYATSIKQELELNGGKLPEKSNYKIQYIDIKKYNVPNHEIVVAAPLRLEELLPPPIFQLELIVYDSNQRVPFNTLSSGETQIAFAVSSFLYHLLNLDSVVQQPEGPYKDLILKFDDNSPSRIEGNRIAYKYINAVFDEVEMYFHPDMQRCFITFLLNGLKQITLENIKAINIMLITHSPFVLSDIPSNSILFLEKHGQRSENNIIRTFGANVYDLLHYSFFLKDSYMGEFARKYINKQIAIICFIRAFREFDSPGLKTYTDKEKKAVKLRFDIEKEYLEKNFKDIYCLLGLNNDDQPNTELAKKLKENFSYEKMLARVEIIDEPVIKLDLEEQINALFATNKKEWLEKQILRYRTELDKMGRE